MRKQQEPTPPRGHLRLVRPKREPGGSSVDNLRRPKKEPEEWAAPDAEEDFLLKQAIAASLNDVPPMSKKDALAWSRKEWAEAEAERQRRLLEEAAQRRDVIEVDSDSDDDWLLSPSPPRFGDGGQGSSSQPPRFSRVGDAGQPKPEPETPPRDSDDDDDGDDSGEDYTVFYRHFGM